MENKQPRSSGDEQTKSSCKLLQIPQPISKGIAAILRGLPAFGNTQLLELMFPFL